MHIIFKTTPHLFNSTDPISFYTIFDPSDYPTPPPLLHNHYPAEARFLYNTDKIQRLQARWLIRRAFDNDQDAGLVAKSFRDIGVLLNVFHVNNPRLWEDMIV